MQFLNNNESLTYAQLNDKFLKLKSTVKGLKQSVLSQVYRANQKNNPALLNDLRLKAVWVDVEELRLKWFVVFFTNSENLDIDSCLAWTVLSTYNLDEHTQQENQVPPAEQFKKAFDNLEKTLLNIVEQNLIKEEVVV